MGTVYVIYLVFLMLEFLAIHNGRAKMAFMFSVATLIAPVVATSIMGEIFWVILDRTLWFGRGIPVWSVFLSVISGIAAMISVTVLTWFLNGRPMGREKQASSRTGRTTDRTLYEQYRDISIATAPPVFSDIHFFFKFYHQNNFISTSADDFP